MNVKKDGEDPAMLADADCPPWLDDLVRPHASIAELSTKGLGNLTTVEGKRMKKLLSRMQIKGGNASAAK